jgi:inosine/guanosine/xanthosine phosphorylase family protein
MMMQPHASIQIAPLKAAAQTIREIWPNLNLISGVILGSGWNEAAEEFQGEEISYSQIPGLGNTGVEGHAGSLVRFQRKDGKDLLLFKGRRHLYEGEGWTPVVLPAYLLHALGAESILLTNAAGGIREDLTPGSLMLFSDHINMLGGNPLIGPHCPSLGPRFPDQTQLYNPDLRDRLKEGGGVDAEGVYLATLGPTFETPAEIRHYRAIGADAVGMSTVPEAILAHALDMQVAAVSFISNVAAGLGSKPLNHELIHQVAQAIKPRMQKLLNHFLQT